MRKPARHFAMLFGLGLLATVAVQAEEDTTTTRLREALRETATKLHDTEAQLEQQQLATAAAERERDALKQAPLAPRKDDSRAVALQRQLAAAAGDLAQAKADAQKSQSEQQASTQYAERKEAERAALAEQIAQIRSRLTDCAFKDDALYATGREIAALYRNPEFIAHVRSIPVPLGFERVRLENRMRALEDRLTDEHVQAERCRTEAAATSPTHPAAAAPSVSSLPPAASPQLTPSEAKK